MDIQEYYRKNPLMVSSPFGGRDFFDEVVFERVLNMLDINIDKKLVLDAGCGRGLVANYCFKRDAYYIGCDFVKSFQGDPHIPFLLADGQRLPFKNEVFDVIFCIDAFEHFPSQKKAAKEFKRVLKKNGTVFLSVPNYSNICGLVKLFEEKCGFYEKGAWAPFGNWKPQVLEQFITPWRIKKVFKNAGFRDFKFVGLDRELITGIFPWIEHPRIPEAIKFRLQRWSPGAKQFFSRKFPHLSGHTFWKIG